jgi:hypothetical protein
VVPGPDRHGKIKWPRHDGTREPGEPEALRLVDRLHVDSVGSGQPHTAACQGEVGSHYLGQGMNQTLGEGILARRVPYAETPLEIRSLEDINKAVPTDFRVGLEGSILLPTPARLRGES